MRAPDLDRILFSMLKTYDGISDLNFTVGHPLQVEDFGELKPVFVDPPIERLTPYQTEQISLLLMQGDRRLMRDYLAEGSCDVSYSLSDEARFRVNIFRQQGNFSIVMRRLQADVPSVASLELPSILKEIATVDAGQSINRILGLFSLGEEKQLRLRLADTLRFVVSQRLAPKVGGGRQLLTEIMGNTLRTRETILLGESKARTFYEIIEANSTFGWCTFDQSILNAYEAGTISEETANIFASRKGRVTRGIDLIQKMRGIEIDLDDTGLRLDLPTNAFSEARK